MRKSVVRLALFGSAAFLVVSVGPKEASAGAFGVREQSAYFLGTSFAGSAAGDDISSMFWNSAATAAKSGCNASSNFTALFGNEKETAEAGLFVSGIPHVAPGLSPTETDVGRSGVVPSSYTTCQLTDRLYVGLGVNAPFGLFTKPDSSSWAGSPLGITSKVFSTDINPTIAFKLTPQLTVGAGVQIEYFSIDLTRGSFNSAAGSPLTSARGFHADSWGAGATAGVLWQPSRTTSIGVGYRSQVEEDVSGDYTRGLGLSPLTLPLSTTAKGSLTLPDEVTLSARQYLSPHLALLATIEWQNWSRLGNVAATSAGCGAAGVCEVLNLNYRDGWFYAIGAEYALSRTLTLRTGIAYETSPIRDSNRDILLPDSNRVHLSAGASYKVTDQVSVDLGYSHLFFEDGTFCIANPTANGGTTHCNAGTPASAVLLTGKTDASADLVAVGVKYKF
jgi:long-chain fatty acid transport protein